MLEFFTLFNLNLMLNMFLLISQVLFTVWTLFPKPLIESLPVLALFLGLLSALKHRV